MSTDGSETVAQAIYIVSRDEFLPCCIREASEPLGISPFLSFDCDEFRQQSTQGIVGCVVVDARDCDEERTLEKAKRVHSPDSDLATCILLDGQNFSSALRLMRYGVARVIDSRSGSDVDWQREIEKSLTVSIRRAEARKKLLSFQDGLRKMTPREGEILTHIMSGKRNRQISQAMHLSQRAIEKYRSRVYHKLGDVTRANLTERFLTRDSGGGRFCSLPHLSELLFDQAFYSNGQSQ